MCSFLVSMDHIVLFLDKWNARVMIPKITKKKTFQNAKTFICMYHFIFMYIYYGVRPIHKTMRKISNQVMNMLLNWKMLIKPNIRIHIQTDAKINRNSKQNEIYFILWNFWMTLKQPNRPNKNLIWENLKCFSEQKWNRNERIFAKTS